MLRGYIKLVESCILFNQMKGCFLNVREVCAESDKNVGSRKGAHYRGQISNTRMDRVGNNCYFEAHCTSFM